ncbi:DUF935 family protein [Babesia caballi]|uniref:DUF935 family protein n=1 Tax=Babesia caballi TaxID=5871 RepID=A0AAV4LQZ7_BABCB|nr:DUF935 family protein [Babesia caballi]
MRARPTALNKSRQKPLAIEVRSHGAVGKRQIAPPAAIVMTPPVDVGKGLVVEGEAAEEDLGALSFVFFTTDTIPLGFIIVGRILARLLNLGDEGCGGVADGGEDSCVGEEIIFSRRGIDTVDITVKISRGFGNTINIRVKFLIS